MWANISPKSMSYVIIFALVILWFIGISILFYKLLRKYTFGAWTKECPNPYEKETFGMPRGIFRGILTLSLLFIVLLMEVVSLQDTGLEKSIEKLIEAFQMMLAFYFGSKVMHHVTKADERKTQAMAAANYEESDAVG
ncbi:MAG: hypothetical protein ACE5IR_01505 [bacterium]